MNKELIYETLEGLRKHNSGVEIVKPGQLSSHKTANLLIHLLQRMYVEHGIAKHTDALVNQIESGDLLTWFCKKGNQYIASSSLVRQSSGWELGRAVSFDRGNGYGKQIVLEALMHHAEVHTGQPLSVEVRLANEFVGIPSGMATQKIFLGMVANMSELSNYAVAPLFAHGKPLRNEQFLFTASDASKGKLIQQQILEAVGGRNTDGEISRMSIIQKEPFLLAVPDGNGVEIRDIKKAALNFSGCSLFPVEATDQNMPLIGAMQKDGKMVFCGVDRTPGPTGKPVILIATLGQGVLLAPTKPNKDVLTPKQIEDIVEITNRFQK